MSNAVVVERQNKVFFEMLGVGKMTNIEKHIQALMTDIGRHGVHPCSEHIIRSSVASGRRGGVRAISGAEYSIVLPVDKYVEDFYIRYNDEENLFRLREVQRARARGLKIQMPRRKSC